MCDNCSPKERHGCEAWLFPAGATGPINTRDAPDTTGLINATDAADTTVLMGSIEVAGTTGPITGTDAADTTDATGPINFLFLITTYQKL